MYNIVYIHVHVHVHVHVHYTCKQYTITLQKCIVIIRCTQKGGKCQYCWNRSQLPSSEGTQQHNIHFANLDIFNFIAVLFLYYCFWSLLSYAGRFALHDVMLLLFCCKPVGLHASYHINIMWSLQLLGGVNCLQTYMHMCVRTCTCRCTYCLELSLTDTISVKENVLWPHPMIGFAESSHHTLHHFLHVSDDLLYILQ